MSGLVLWIAVGVIGAGVALIIAAPLLRAGQRMSRGAGAMYDLAVFRDQLTEVDRDLESGLLSETEATAARTEIERRMLRAVDGHSDALTGDALTGDVDNAAAPARFAAAAFPLALGMLVAVAAVALYLNTGAPDQQDAPFAMRTDITPTARAPGQAGSGGGADSSRMRAQLRQRLDANPNDMAGWVMLARTERALGDHQNSVQAFARAIELAGAKASADLMADYGEALVFESFGTVSPRATEVFERALLLDSREIKSRFYIAAGRAQAGDYKGAIALWRGLTADAPPDAPWIKEVRARISDAAMKGGIMPISVTPERPSTIAGAESGLGGAIAGNIGPSAEDVKSAQAMAPEDRTAFIKSMVQRLAYKMEENPDDVDGWLRLGRAYSVLKEDAKSKAAYGQAKRRLMELLANIPADSPNRPSLQATLTEIEGLIAE